MGSIIHIDENDAVSLAPGSTSVVLRPRGCGRGALGTLLVECNRWKLAFSVTVVYALVACVELS